jgi:hypothetical protein
MGESNSLLQGGPISRSKSTELPGQNESPHKPANKSARLDFVIRCKIRILVEQGIQVAYESRGKHCAGSCRLVNRIRGGARRDLKQTVGFCHFQP